MVWCRGRFCCRKEKEVGLVCWLLVKEVLGVLVD